MMEGATAATIPVSADPARLLIVEDEAIVARDLQGRLKRLGYDVCGIVATGADAIAAAVQHRPDLVLMDIVLKGDMDGIEAAQVINRDHQIPIVFLTAWYALAHVAPRADTGRYHDVPALPELEALVGRADGAREIVFEQFRFGRRSILDVLSYDLERFSARARSPGVSPMTGSVNPSRFRSSSSASTACSRARSSAMAHAAAPARSRRNPAFFRASRRLRLWRRH